MHFEFFFLRERHHYAVIHELVSFLEHQVYLKEKFGFFSDFSTLRCMLTIKRGKTCSSSSTSHETAGKNKYRPSTSRHIHLLAVFDEHGHRILPIRQAEHAGDGVVRHQRQQVPDQGRRIRRRNHIQQFQHKVPKHGDIRVLFGEGAAHVLQHGQHTAAAHQVGHPVEEHFLQLQPDQHVQLRPRRLKELNEEVENFPVERRVECGDLVHDDEVDRGVAALAGEFEVAGLFDGFSDPLDHPQGYDDEFEETEDGRQFGDHVVGFGDLQDFAERFLSDFQIVLHRGENETSNQSINRTMDQSIDRSINQSINKSINHSKNQSINQPNSRSINRKINQSIDQSIQLILNDDMKKSRIIQTDV